MSSSRKTSLITSPTETRKFVVRTKNKTVTKTVELENRFSRDFQFHANLEPGKGRKEFRSYLDSLSFNKTLPQCQTVEEVEAWLISSFRVFNAKALRAVQWRNLKPDIRYRLESLLLQPGACPIFQMNDLGLTLETYRRLQKELNERASAYPEFEFALVTLISGDGGTSQHRPVIEWTMPRERFKRVLRRMAPNSIGVSEISLFNSMSHPEGGAFLQRHEHAIIFGPEIIGKAREVAQRAAKEIPANATGAATIQVKPFTRMTPINISRMAAYLLKAPDKAKNWCPEKDGKGGHMNHSEKGDRYSRYLRLAQLRTMLPFEDVIMGVGQGNVVKRGLVDLSREMAKVDAKRPVAFHPDEIAAFWIDLAKELSSNDWALPVIKRNP